MICLKNTYFLIHFFKILIYIFFLKYYNILYILVKYYHLIKKICSHIHNFLLNKIPI